MKDRYLVGSLASGFAALTVGVLTSAMSADRLGVVAGILGFGAAICAAGVSGRHHHSDSELAARTEECEALRQELDSLNAIFHEPADSVPDSLAFAPPLDHASGVDAGSGLLDQQFFRVLVQQRVAAARRHLQPLAVVMFEVDGLDRVDLRSCDDALGSLGSIVVRTLRESDAACRVGATMAAAILEDTAEAGAVWAAERIRGILHQSDPKLDFTISAGVACYPTHALSATELIDRAGSALDAARAHGRDRLEIATSDEAARPLE
ncbi:MAG: GGDEF domain-containing protein [Acidimicrobiia bacterium]